MALTVSLKEGSNQLQTCPVASQLSQTSPRVARSLMLSNQHMNLEHEGPLVASVRKGFWEHGWLNEARHSLSPPPHIGLSNPLVPWAGGGTSLKSTEENSDQKLTGPSLDEISGIRIFPR